MRLQPGDEAPAFSALDQDGGVRSSEHYSGTKLAVFFYPRAFTPGCTTEVCDFRDRHEFFSGSGYAIVGVSPDSPEKLAKFKDDYNLPFDLLSDPEHEIATVFGAYGPKKNYGREYKGIIRSTFLIDASGVITDAYYNVRAKGHADRVAKALRQVDR